MPGSLRNIHLVCSLLVTRKFGHVYYTLNGLHETRTITRTSLTEVAALLLLFLPHPILLAKNSGEAL